MFDLPANPEHNTAIATAPNPNQGFCSTCNNNALKVTSDSQIEFIQESKQRTTKICVMVLWKGRPHQTQLSYRIR